MNRKLGYARVSTVDQNLDLQIDALKKAGCDEQLIFTDKVSGIKSIRPGLTACIAELKPGDTLIVWKLDRIGRSMHHLVNLVHNFRINNIAFKSIQDGAIDTTTASGELMFNIFSALADFERKLIQERTNAGLRAARARGKQGGRPKITSNNSKVKAAKAMHNNVNTSINDICSSLHISKATLYRYLKL